VKRWRRSVGISVATGGLALSGLLVTATTPASAGARAVAPHPSSVPLDHMLCYNVKATGFKPPANVLLKNFIQPNQFAPKFGNVATHCNPTFKQVQLVTGGLRTYKVVNPNAHLLCWNISYQYTSLPIVMTNQFGKSIMLTSPGPKSLCVPSWKKRTGPPNKVPATPPRLDHFTCYGLTNLPKPQYGFHIPPLVKVLDEFSFPKFTQVKLGIADKLCVPTTKVHNGVVFAPQAQNDQSLVCFPSTKTPYWKVFFDENQFGTGRVFPVPPTAAQKIPFEELCLPTQATLG
jgi:hypothetical protein